MIYAEHRYGLPVSAAVFFDYIADPGNDVEWQGSCLASSLIDTDRPEVGTRYRIAFSFMGRRSDFIGCITEREPHREYAFEVVEGPFKYRGRYSVVPAQAQADPAAERKGEGEGEGAGAGCAVHWQFWAEPGGIFGIVPASLLRKALVSQVVKDVAGLRRRFAAPRA